MEESLKNLIEKLLLYAPSPSSTWTMMEDGTWTMKEEVCESSSSESLSNDKASGTYIDESKYKFREINVFHDLKKDIMYVAALFDVDGNPGNYMSYSCKRLKNGGWSRPSHVKINPQAGYRGAPDIRFIRMCNIIKKKKLALDIKSEKYLEELSELRKYGYTSPEEIVYDVILSNVKEDIMQESFNELVEISTGNQIGNCSSTSKKYEVDWFTKVFKALLNKKPLDQTNFLTPMIGVDVAGKNSETSYVTIEKNDPSLPSDDVSVHTIQPNTGYEISQLVDGSYYQISDGGIYKYIPQPNPMVGYALEGEIEPAGYMEDELKKKNFSIKEHFFIVKCLDNTGYETKFTVGFKYKAYEFEGDMFSVFTDDGETLSVFSDRFEVVDTGEECIHVEFQDKSIPILSEQELSSVSPNPFLPW